MAELHEEEIYGQGIVDMRNSVRCSGRRLRMEIKTTGRDGQDLKVQYQADVISNKYI